jgi:hypothetical protein
VKKFGLVFGSLLLTLAILEVVLKLFGLPARRATVRDLENKTYVLDCYPSKPTGSFNVDLRNKSQKQLWEMRLEQSLEEVAQNAPYAVSIQYNSLGLRGEEIPQRAPGILHRVVFIGDSFTEGEGVLENNTYPRKLDSYFDASERGKWQIINGGKRGLDFPDLLWLLQIAQKLQPDIIIYAMILNDPEQSREFHARQNYANDWILDRRGMGTNIAPPKFHLLAYVEELVDTIRISRSTTRWYREMYEGPNAAGWEKTKEDIHAMAESCRKNGQVFAMLLWPLLVDLDDYPFRSIHRKIHAFANQEKIPFMDLLDTFERLPTKTLWVHSLDHHPNEYAHEIAAKALVPFVRSLAQ